jgi:DNA-binding response OmpR family regulator
MLSNALYFIAGVVVVLLYKWLYKLKHKQNSHEQNHTSEPVDVFESIESQTTNTSSLPSSPSQPEQEKHHEEASPRSRPLILMIEDDSEISQYMADMFAEHYTVIVEEDGRKGIEQANLLQPDLVITDVMLPSMNGKEVCRQLKNSFDTSHIPVIMLTAMSQENDIIQGLGEGADSYLTKPFNIKVVMAQAASLIRSRQLWRQRLGKPLLQCPDNISIPAIDQRFMDQVIQTLEEELANPAFDVTMMVGRLHMGHSTVLRKLKALTGMSPVDYIRSYRMQKAAYIFQKEKLPVSEVSYRVGYADPKYFSKCFTKEFGKTPTDYMRDIHRN